MKTDPQNIVCRRFYCCPKKRAQKTAKFFQIVFWAPKIWCLDNCAAPQLDTMTLRPALSDTVTIRPTNVFILRQSDPTGVGQSDHTQAAQFDPLEVGLNFGCDNPTHVQSDPFSASPDGLEDSSGDNTQMALLKNGAAPPKRTSPTHGSAGRKLDLT
jgi:hypothetical protein